MLTCPRAVRGDESLMSELQQRGVDLYTSHTVKEAVGTEDGIESVTCSSQ